MDNSLSGYIIEPLANREGCKVFYANITEASDIPFWAFKRFCQEKVIGSGGSGGNKNYRKK